MMARWMLAEFGNSFTLILPILLLFLTDVNSSGNVIVYAEGEDCSSSYELGAATVYSQYPQRTNYSHNIDCQLKFSASKFGWKLMLRIDYINIPDKTFNHYCNDALYIYDSDRISNRPFKAAGANSGLCGNNAPAVLYSSGQDITVYFRTNDDGPVGKGFRFQVTAYLELPASGIGCGPNFECSSTSDFDVEKCIDRGLVCDGVDHCVDGSDEEDKSTSQCKPTVVTTESVWDDFLSLGIAACIGIIVGAIVVIVLVIVCIVCTCRRCGKNPHDTDHRQSIPISTHGSMQTGNAAPYNKAAVTYHQAAAMSNNPQMMNQMPNGQYTQQGYYPMTTMQQQPQLSSVPQPRYVQQQQPFEGHVPMTHAAGSGAFNQYNSPFHMVRDNRESHSYSSGYSSQQGVHGAAGFQPMHTKPIISTRGYTPTSASSRSTSSRETHSRDPYHDQRQRLTVAL